jgi:hypothetical protein
MKGRPNPIKVCVPFGDGDCPEYTVESSIEGRETTTAVVCKIKPNKDKPICIETDVAVRYVTTDEFVEDVRIPDKYRSKTPDNVTTSFVPDGVGISTKELFEADYCHFCESVLDHHHHVTYEPETVIPVCHTCHGKLHTDGGFRRTLSCTEERPDNYDSDFKTLLKQYRLAVDDTALFQVEGGFEYNPPSAGLLTPDAEDRLVGMGLLAGGLND